MALYDITQLNNPTPYENTNATSKFIAKLSDTRFVIAWFNSGTVKYVQTFELNRNTGAITENSTPFNFYSVDFSLGQNYRISVIDETHFIIFWQGTAGTTQGYCRTFQVDAITGAVSFWGSLYSFDNNLGNVGDSCVMAIDDSNAHVFYCWRGTGTQGLASIFTINRSDGSVSHTNPYNYSSNGTTASCKKISDTKVLVCFREGSPATGWARILNINTSTWVITAAASSFNYLASSTVSQNSTEIMSTSPLTALNAYDLNSTANIRQLSINDSTWAISNLGTPVTGIASVTQNNQKNVILRIDDEHFIYFYTGANDDGYVQTRSFNPSTGAISSPIDNIEFDTDNGTYISACDMGRGLYVASWTSDNSVGMVQAFSIELPTPPTRLKIKIAGNWENI